MNKRHFSAMILLVSAVLYTAGCGTGGSSGTTGGTSGTEPMKWHTAALIENNDAGNAQDVIVAMNDAGSAVAVWLASDGDTTSIWANTFTASTGLWGTPVLVENDDTGGAGQQDVAIDASGNAIAVWVQRSGQVDNVWANRYTASTGLWGTPALIDISALEANRPKIAMDPSGNATAVWYHFDNGRNMNDIWANRYDESTGLWGTAEMIESDDTGNAYNVQVAMDPDGNAMAVWSQKSGTWYNIYANRYSDQSGSWTGRTLIETIDTGGATGAVVNMDASGNAIAVWNQYDGSNENIWTNRYTSSTGLWGTASLLESDDAGDAYNPSIGIDGSGNAIAVWNQYDGATDSIYASRYNFSTGQWGAATLIETGGVDGAYGPKVAVNASGDAVALWNQSADWVSHIWSNRFNASTGLWGTAEEIEQDEDWNSSSPDVAIDGTGRAVAVWYQYDGDVNNIWANLYK